MKLKPTRIRHIFEEIPYDLATDKPWLTQDGTKRWWYNNGQLICETPYINGQKHGLVRGWKSNGQLKYKDLYVYGEKRDSNMPRLEQVIHYGFRLV